MENSPYSNTPVTSYYLDILNKPIIQEKKDDIYYIVEPKFEYRPDLLSSHFYGTSSYWYVFLLRNMDSMEDPIYDLVAGMEIRIPTEQSVKNMTFESKENN